MRDDEYLDTLEVVAESPALRGGLCVLEYKSNEIRFCSRSVPETGDSATTKRNNDRFQNPYTFIPSSYHNLKVFVPPFKL